MLVQHTRDDGTLHNARLLDSTHYMLLASYKLHAVSYPVATQLNSDTLAPQQKTNMARSTCVLRHAVTVPAILYWVP